MRTSSLAGLLVSVSCVATTVAIGCGRFDATYPDCNFDLTCDMPASADASVDAPSTDGDAQACRTCAGDTDTGTSVVDTGIDGPPGCDVTKSPADDACVIDESVGVFVDSAAADAGAATGTKASPFGAIGAALVAAKASGKRVYVCAGTYDDLLQGGSRSNRRAFSGSANQRASSALPRARRAAQMTFPCNDREVTC